MEAQVLKCPISVALIRPWSRDDAHRVPMWQLLADRVNDGQAVMDSSHRG